MRAIFAAPAVLLFASSLLAAEAALNSIEGLELENVKAEVVTYRGKRGVRLVEAVPRPENSQTIAILNTSEFGDGVIEAEIAGLPAAGANEGARGFVGIAFRVQPD